MRQTLALLALLMLSACADATTTTGTLLDEDLRPLMPDVVVGVPPEDTTDYSETFELGGATLRVAWHTATVENDLYILGATVEVTQPAQGVELGASLSDSPMNFGTEDAVLTVVTFAASWFEDGVFRSQGGSVMGEIHADGTFVLHDGDALRSDPP